MIGSCNSKFWILLAPVYSLVASMLEMTWCVQLLCAQKTPTDKHSWSPWNIMEEIQGTEVVVHFTWVSFVLHLLWFVTSIAMIYENMISKSRAIVLWMISTGLVTLWSIISSVYFIFQYKNAKPMFDGDHNSAFLILFILYSGGLFFWLVNVSLMLILRKKCMASCSGIQQINNPKGGTYNRLKNSNISLNSSHLTDDNIGLHLEDVIFEAGGLPSEKIFHIKNVNSTNFSGF